MKQGPPEDFTSPLDELLEELPQEPPPADLEKRCLRALREAEKEVAATPFWTLALKSVAGLAAAFILVVGILTITFPRAKRPVSSSMTQALSASRPQSLLQRDLPKEAAPPFETTAAQAPAQTPPSHLDESIADSLSVSNSAQVARKSAAGTSLWEGPLQAEEAPSPFSRQVAKLSRDQEAELTAPSGEAEAPPPPLPWPGGDTALSRPWRDLSGERQKITRKEMELEVEDVEEAYERATAIIERADGYVDSEELRIDAEGNNSAHLLARVPVDRLSGVVAQLRELGKVVKLIGESDDRTKEYQARSAHIRELGAKECELVEKYEKETNRRRKQQLYQQIMAIRQQNKREKAPLLELSDKTHFAFLDLTLTEAAGPGRFLLRVLSNARTVSLWLAVSAIFWVPALLILMAVWRAALRRRS